MSEDIIEYKYFFALENKGKLNYSVKIRTSDLSLVVEDEKAKSAKWTDLDYHKCSNCPLNSKESPKCPVAMGLHQVTEFFSDDISFTKTKVTVAAEDRAYFKEASLQQTLSSIVGLIIATSGCPHTIFFKPMARFHLPFASQSDTLFRTFGAWLIRQYFEHKNGGDFDFDLKKLGEKYDSVTQMNVGLIERIRSFTKGDANRNALLVLHCFSGQVQNEISENLNELKSFFPELKK